MIDHTVPVARAREGVRAWVRSAGAGLRRASPYGIVAFLAAAAVAPVAGAVLGASNEMSAALQQLGGMGSNYLADALSGTAGRLREGASTEELRDALATDLLTRLDAGETGLRDEIASVLRAVDAVEVALRAADDGMRSELVAAFGSLGDDVGHLRVLATDAAEALARIGVEQRQQTELLRQSLVAAHQIMQEVRRRPPAAPRELAPGQDPGGPAPYPGMASFDAIDARYFRGRETLVADLLGRLSEHAAGGPPLVVVGVSGAGKSSLLRAGVLPSLDLDRPWVIMTPGAAPLAELTGRLSALGSARKLVLVDQFEELFTQCADPAERLAFAAALAGLAPDLLIISVRADFYPQCTELPPLAGMLSAGQVVVGPLGPAELRRAIREPAAIAGYRLEPGLEDLLLADLGAVDRGGALPLLAHALRATWDRREGDTMTVAGYRATGGIRRAVAESAERIYLGLDDAGRTALRRAVLGLVTIVDDLPVRHRATRAEADLGVLRPMIEARLVTAGEDTVEVSHEALLTGWPRLAGWLVEERQAILLRQRLALATEDWLAAGEDPDAVYRGARLDAAREWAAGRSDLPEAQQRFLAAGRSVARRSAGRLRGVVAALAVLLVLAVAGGVVALNARDVARSRQLAAESRTATSLNDHEARTKAIDAWDAAHTTEARTALISAQQTVTLGRLGSDVGAYRVAVSPDGSRVAVGFYDGRLQLWDARTFRQIGADFRQPGDEVTLVGLEFSPDGRYLASSSLSLPAAVSLWDGATGRPLRTLTAFGAIAWLPGDGGLLAIRTDGDHPGQDLGTWDPATGRQTGTLRMPLVRGALAVAVSADGGRVAVTSLGRAELVRRSDGRSLLALTDRTYYDVAFTADGRLLTFARDASQLTSYDAGTGRRLGVLSDPDAPLGGGQLAVTPDSTVLVQAGEQNEIQRLKADGGGPRPSFSQYRGVAASMALSADAHLLAVAGSGATMLFRLGVDRLDHPQLVGYLAYQPGGRLLATGSNDPRIRIWDTATSNVAATIPLPGATEGPIGLAWGARDTIAATTSDGRVLVLGADGRLRHTFRAGTHRIAADPAISPDGTLLAVAIDGDGPDRDKNDYYVRERRREPKVLVWDLLTGTRVAGVDAPGHLVLHLAFTPDGRQLLGTAGSSATARSDVPNQTGAVFQWQVDGMRLLASRSLPFADGADDGAVSPDGRTYAVATDSGHAALFRTDGLVPAGTIGHHDYEAAQVAWSPDGRLLATSSNDEGDPIRLWDVATGDPVAAPRAQGNTIQDLQFSPDGRTLASASGDWTVALFHLDPDDAVRRLCDVTGPAAQAEEWTSPRLCR
ncbi:NACHT and WD repeat domain-containing protein [Actinoplanes sp. NPDC049265]|uniref:NACHT and WD repeat domain-containing protein n=1 Tax=Actinoplanes sp. NPDC049265 TaxID=3363902 RepID=UPI00371ED049